MSKTSFTKMHGLGNDFVIVDAITEPFYLNKEQIKFLANRNFGIGFDQLLVIRQSKTPSVDFLYQIFNVDGEESEHCGNGARCLGKYIFDRKLTKKAVIKVETKNRQILIKRDSDNEISVDMGTPCFSPHELNFKTSEKLVTYQRNLELKDKRALTVSFSAISMGNPHAIIIVDSVAAANLEEIGPALSNHADFTQKVNVGFLEPISELAGKLRVFERGVGETLACGTGACAAVVAGRVLGLFREEVEIHLHGGPLKILWKGKSHDDQDNVVMKGRAAEVFNGSFDIVNIQRNATT